MLLDDLLAETIETGVSASDSTQGFADIARREVELAGKFPVVASHRRGFRERGRQECVQLDRGYAPVASADDSGRLSF